MSTSCFVPLRKSNYWVTERMNTKWLDNDVLALIAAVKPEPALWDPNSKHFRRKDLKEDMWEAVAEKVGHSAPSCQLKFRYLRDQFRENWHKMKDKRGTSDDSPSVPRWKFWKQLQFLRDTYKRPRPLIELEEPSTSNHFEFVKVESASSPEQAEDMPLAYEPRAGSRSPQTDLESQECQDLLESRVLKQPNDTVPAPRCNQNNSSAQQDGCAEVCFGNFVGQRLRELSPQKRQRLIVKITNLLYSEDE